MFVHQPIGEQQHQAGTVSLPQPEPSALRALDHQAWASPRGAPEGPPPPPAPPTGARRALPAAVPPPRDSTGARSGAHQTGRSLPLPRGPATAGGTGRASQKLSLIHISSQPRGCWCRTSSPPGPSRSGNSTTKLALSASRSPSPALCGRSITRPGRAPEERRRAPLRRPLPRRVLAELCPQPCRPRETPPAPAQEPTRRADPSRYRGARPRRAAPAELARSCLLYTSLHSLGAVGAGHRPPRVLADRGTAPPSWHCQPPAARAQRSAGARSPGLGEPPRSAGGPPSAARSPDGLPQPEPSALRALDHQAWASPRGAPEGPPPPPAPPTGARRALPAAVPPPRDSTGARSGAHQTGRSLPLPRGPATAGGTGRASQKLSLIHISSQPRGCWCRTSSPPGPSRSGNSTTKLALSASRSPSPALCGRSITRPGRAPEERRRAPLRRPLPRRVLAELCPQPCRPRETPPAPAQEPTRRADPSRYRGARPRRAAPAELARSCLLYTSLHSLGAVGAGHRPPRVLADRGTATPSWHLSLIHISSQPRGCWCRTSSPPGPSRSGNSNTKLALSASRSPSPALCGRTAARPGRAPEACPRAPLRRPHRRRLLAELCPQPCRPREAPPAPAQEPTRRADPSRYRGARPRRASPAELARSFSDARPGHPDSPTPLAESPTIPSAAPTRQPHFRALGPAPARANPEARH
ncbi:hypothetical protein NN561_008184 [Cricetulus griseus]